MFLLYAVANSTQMVLSSLCLSIKNMVNSFFRENVKLRTRLQKDATIKLVSTCGSYAVRTLPLYVILRSLRQTKGQKAIVFTQCLQ